MGLKKIVKKKITPTEVKPTEIEEIEEAVAEEEIEEEVVEEAHVEEEVEETSEDVYSVEQVPTATEPVIYNSKTNKAYTLHEAVVMNLNMTHKILNIAEGEQ